MNDSPEWSTNEVEKRYSQDLLDAAKYLLSIDDPDSEVDYGSGLNDFFAEPGETLLICRDTADWVVWNAANRKHPDALPLIKEDMLFVELEMKKQQNANKKDKESWGLVKYWPFTGVMLLALFIGMTAGLVEAGTILWTGAWLGLWGIVMGGYIWGRMHYRTSQRQKYVLDGLDHAEDVYLNNWKYYRFDDNVNG